MTDEKAAVLLEGEALDDYRRMLFRLEGLERELGEARVRESVRVAETLKEVEMVLGDGGTVRQAVALIQARLERDTDWSPLEVERRRASMFQHQAEDYAIQIEQLAKERSDLYEQAKRVGEAEEEVRRVRDLASIPDPLKQFVRVMAWRFGLGEYAGPPLEWVKERAATRFRRAESKALRLRSQVEDSSPLPENLANETAGLALDLMQAAFVYAIEERKVREARAVRSPS